MTSYDDAQALRLSRRGAMLSAARMLAVAAASWTAFETGAARAQEKITQKAANYQDHPNNSKACAGCSHFQPPNACHLVAGKISPQGWCKYFAAKISSQ